MAKPTWESLGAPERLVEEWKEWGFEPAHIVEWREKVKAATDEHHLALKKMVDGEWPGVSQSDVATAVASARNAASESSDPIPFGIGVIGRGEYPYPPGERRYLEGREWVEFLVVVAEREYGVVVGAALPRDYVERVGADEAERRLPSLFAESAQRLFGARTTPESVIFDFVMHIGPIPFDPERWGS
jgi:hypothetical protein